MSYLLFLYNKAQKTIIEKKKRKRHSSEFKSIQQVKKS